MNEQEFLERIKSIKSSVDNLSNFAPLMASNYKKELFNMAANILQIEEGITRYSRPKSWDLISEGVSSATKL